MFEFEETNNMQELMTRAVERGLFDRAVFGATTYLTGGVCREKFACVDAGTLGYPTKYKYEPISPDSPFDIASVTKAFVSLLYHTLQGSGALDFNQRQVDSDTLVAPILGMKGDFVGLLTVGHLLGFCAQFAKGHPTQEVIRQGFHELECQLLYGGLMEKPGINWKYGNPHTILLGLLLEKLTGKSLLELIQGTFLHPLKMNSTTLTPFGNLGKVVMSEPNVNLGTIHDPTARFALQEKGIMIGSAGLFSSARDLLILLRMLLNRGVHKNRQIVAPHIVRGLHKGITSKFGNGFGRWSVFRENLENLAVLDDEGIFKTGHTGSIIVVLPRYHLAYTILTDYRMKRRTPDEQKKAWSGLCQLFAAASHKALLEFMLI